MGYLKEKSPRDKHWLSSEPCEAVCEGQATQQDVAGFLQGRALGDRGDDGQVTKKCKNGTGSIDSGKKNIVDVGSCVVPHDANPTWQPANGAVFIPNHFVLEMTC